MTHKLESKEKCILCGNLKDLGMRDCGNHPNMTYKEYHKIKSKVWNDPWYVTPIGMGGWTSVLVGFTALFYYGFNEKFAIIMMPYTFILSIIIPIITVILFHNYKQKKKNLPFWGLTNDQEADRLMTLRGKGN